MAALSGWLAVSMQPTIGVNAPPTDAGYLRQEIAWDGSPQTNEQQRMPAGPQVEHSRAIRYAVVYDSQVAGYPLVFWRALPDYTTTPAALPPTTVMIAWDLIVLQALNATTLYGGTSEICMPQRFDAIGRCNGLQIYAGVKLCISDGRICRPGRVKGALQAVGASA
jgi:hypothetical protein